jgi:hypothetical protein
MPSSGCLPDLSRLDWRGLADVRAGTWRISNRRSASAWCWQASYMRPAAHAGRDHLQPAETFNSRRWAMTAMRLCAELEAGSWRCWWHGHGSLRRHRARASQIGAAPKRIRTRNAGGLPLVRAGIHDGRRPLPGGQPGRHPGPGGDPPKRCGRGIPDPGQESRKTSSWLNPGARRQLLHRRRHPALERRTGHRPSAILARATRRAPFRLPAGFLSTHSTSPALQAAMPAGAAAWLREAAKHLPEPRPATDHAELAARWMDRAQTRNWRYGSSRPWPGKPGARISVPTSKRGWCACCSCIKDLRTAAMTVPRTLRQPAVHPAGTGRFRPSSRLCRKTLSASVSASTRRPIIVRVPPSPTMTNAIELTRPAQDLSAQAGPHRLSRRSRAFP